jgi:hypothetical protein
VVTARMNLRGLIGRGLGAPATTPPHSVAMSCRAAMGSHVELYQHCHGESCGTMPTPPWGVTWNRANMCGGLVASGTVDGSSVSAIRKRAWCGHAWQASVSDSWPYIVGWLRYFGMGDWGFE